MDHNKIVEALRTVQDPKTGLDIVEAKLVSELRVTEKQVSFAFNNLELEGEMKSTMNFACISAIQSIYPEAGVHVHMHSEHEDKKSLVLPQVTNIIAVASGKGGVGKSTMSVNLAYGLKEAGYEVGILDADLYGPSIPTMLGLQGLRPKIETLYGKHKIVPLCHEGVYAISLGFIIEPEQAVVLRGPRLGGIIKQFINDCLWPKLDYLIIDLPPGTGDIQLTMVQTVPVTGSIIVTTPQEVAVVDAVKAMNMFLLPNVNVPILGVIENMSWFTPEELPDNKYLLFGEGGGKRVAEIAESELLGQVPLIQGIREGGDSGKPAILDDDHLAKPYFKNVVNQLISQVEKRNKEMKPTETVKIIS